MSVIFLGRVDEFDPVQIGHSAYCLGQHDGRHCYPYEAEAELRLVGSLAEKYPGIELSRQESWRGIGRPDIVARRAMAGFTALTIIEVKRVPAGEREWEQLYRYVNSAKKWAHRQPGEWSITGYLAAFCDSVRSRHDDCGFMPMVLD